MNDLAPERLGIEPQPDEISPAARPAPPGRMPRWAVVGIFLLLLVAGLAHARAFLMPVVMAFLLTLVFSPVRRFLGRHGLPSGLSALLIVGVLLSGIVAGLLMLAAPIAQWIDRGPSIFGEIENKIRDFRGAAAAVAEAGDRVDKITRGGGGAEPPEVVVKEPGIASSLALLAPAAITQIVFVLVLLFFLLSSGDMIYEKIVHVLPTLKDKKRAIRIARDIERRLSSYLFAITLINAGLGVSIGLVMWLIGMPNPVLFGVMAFAFNFIPYAGAVAGVAIATLVGLVSLEHVSEAILAGAAYLLLTSVEGQFVTPYFVGRQLRLNTVVVFLSVALWAWLWSVVGMIVATPLLVAIRTFCEYIPPLHGLGAFLSARGSEQEEEETSTTTT